MIVTNEVDFPLNWNLKYGILVQHNVSSSTEYGVYGLP